MCFLIVSVYLVVLGLLTCVLGWFLLCVGWFWIGMSAIVVMGKSKA